MSWNCFMITMNCIRISLIRSRFMFDSPLATDATEIFRKNAHYFNDRIKERIKKGDELFYFRNLNFTKSIDQSKALNDNASPKVIISSSGMADAGRVQHHLKHYLWKPKSSIVFCRLPGRRHNRKGHYQRGKICPDSPGTDQRKC